MFRFEELSHVGVSFILIGGALRGGVGRRVGGKVLNGVALLSLLLLEEGGGAPGRDVDRGDTLRVGERRGQVALLSDLVRLELIGGKVGEGLR